MTASSGTERAMERTTRRIYDELRLINATIAASAIIHEDEEARRYLESAVADGIAIRQEEAKRQALRDSFG